MPSQDKRTDKTRKAVIQTAGYRETADPAEVGGDGSMCIKEDPYIICDGCGGKIHKETDEYEQDDCYEIDGYMRDFAHLKQVFDETKPVFIRSIF